MLNTKQVMSILRDALENITKVIHKKTGRDLTYQIKNSKRSILLYARNYLDTMPRKEWADKIEESLLHAFSKVVGLCTTMKAIGEIGINPGITANDLSVEW